jgi:hypothetical protein
VFKNALMVPTGLVHRDLPVDLVTDVPSKGKRSVTVNIGLLGLQRNAVEVCDGHGGSKPGGAESASTAAVVCTSRDGLRRGV